MKKNKVIAGIIIILIITSAMYSIGNITAQPENFVFIHLTDTHIGNTNSEQQLQIAINEINSMDPLPDFVAITGDLTQDGTWEQYTIFKNLIDQFIVPVYVGRGNHDAYSDPDGTYFQEYFGDLYYSFDYGSHHFVMLDSSNPPEHWGHIEADQLAWLSEDLALVGIDTPVFLFLHHMVFGWEWFGWDGSFPPGGIGRGIDNGQQLLETIEDYNIKRIFFGHIHANSEIYYDGFAQMSTTSSWLSDMGPEGYGIINVSSGGMTYDFKILGGDLVHKSYERIVVDVDFWTNGTVTSPTIDGVLSPGEWEDAWKIVKTSPGGYEWRVYVKQDRKYLFVAWNVSDASVHEGDNVSIQIDSNDDSIYDYLSSIYRNGAVFDYPLDYKPGVPFASVEVTSDSNVYQIEASVLLSNIGNPDGKEAVRIVLTTEDGDTHICDVWPDNAEQDPEFWARMVSSNGWGNGSIVGLWHFDEGSGNVASDSSENGNNGTVNGALWVDGIAGKALSFDGDNDYVNVTGAEVLRIIDDVTVEALIKPDSLCGLSIVAAQGELDTMEENNWLYAIFVGSDGRVGYYHEYNNTSRVYIWTDSSVVSVGEWFKIDVTRDAAFKEVRIYINETLVKSGSYAESPTGGSSTNFYVGGMDSQFSFDGIVDEVQVWDEVLGFGPQVGLWHFDEGTGTTVHDSSGYCNDGVINGAVWVDGRFGKALDFDGVDDRVVVAADTSLNTRYNMTLEAWVKRGSIGTAQVIMGRRTSTSGWSYFIRFNVDNTIVFAISSTGDDTGYSIVATTDVYTDTTSWHHIAATYQYVTDGTSIMRIYHNGQPVAETSSAVGPIVSDTDRDLWIGAREQLTSNQWFDGAIDDVQVWNEERTAEEILEDARIPPLVGFWRFDEGAGTTAYDSGEWNNDGTISGATWVFGRYDKALDFDGVDDRVVVAADTSLNTRYNMTLEAWVKRGSIGTAQVIMGRRTSTSGWSYFIRFNVDNTIVFAISSTGDDTGYSIVATTDVYTDTTSWHHIAATYQYVTDGTSIMRIYHNGSLAAETTSAVGPIVYDTVRDLWIGAREQLGSESWFNGTIDEVKIWSEIHVPTPALVGFWRFDEGAGTTAYDSSNYGNDGTLIPQIQRAFSGALGFDGVDDRVVVAADASLNTRYNMTLEAWVKRGSIGTTQVIIARRIGANSWTYFVRFNGDDTITFAVSSTGDDSGYTALKTDDAYTNTTSWHHVAATYQYVTDGTSIMRIYYDGEQVANTTSAVGPIVSDTTRDVWIGARGQSGSEQWFNGSIDEVRVSNVSRTSFNLTVPPSVDADTVALLHFNEETGSTAHDETAYNNDGTINGATWLLSGPTWTTSGRYNGALIFDGVNDHVEVPDSDSLEVSSKITLEAWIYPYVIETSSSAPYYNQAIVHKHNYTDNDRSYYLGLRGDKILFYLTSDGTTTTQKTLTSATSLAANVWTHVAAVSDGTTMKLFINGVADPNTTPAPANIYMGPQPLIVGAYLPNTGYEWHFNGIIDEVAVFNEVDSVHDLVVSSVTFWRTVVGEGTNCTIQLCVVVENQGEYTETFNVTLYYNLNSIGNQTVYSLESKDFTIVAFIWNTTDVSKGNYTITAKATPVPEEMNTTDNTYTDGVIKITIPGDVDGDRDVDIFDVVKITGIYDSKRGDPQFNPNSDLDCNGKIEIYDVVMCTCHYGEKDP